MAIVWFGIVVLFTYGFYCVVWPNHARRQYLRYFDVAAPFKWYKSGTYLRSNIPTIAFRLFGLLLLGLGIFLIYLRIRENGVSSLGH